MTTSLQKRLEKRFVHKGKDNQHLLSVARYLWESVPANDKKAAYCLYEDDVNAIHGQASYNNTSLNLSKVTQFQDQAQSTDHYFDCSADYLDTSSSSSFSLPSESTDQFIDESLGVCPLLHLACQTADNGMVELFLQHGANINASDSTRGQTPLHHFMMEELQLQNYFLPGKLIQKLLTEKVKPLFSLSQKPL